LEVQHVGPKTMSKNEPKQAKLGILWIGIGVVTAFLLGILTGMKL
jgi:hypothetical protein